MHNKTIAVFGDSITTGYPYQNSWVNIVENSTNLAFVNRAVNGMTLEEILYRLRKELSTIQCHYVFFMGGTNDVYIGKKSGDLLEVTVRILNIIKQLNLQPIIGRPVPILYADFEAELAIYRDEITHLAPTIHFDKLYYKNHDLQNHLLPDGIHPSEEGYNLMGRLATEFFLDLPDFK